MIDYIQPDAAIQLQRDPFTPSVALLKYAPYLNMRPDVDLDPAARVPMGSQHTRQGNYQVAIGISSLAQCRTGFQLPSFHSSDNIIRRTSKYTAQHQLTRSRPIAVLIKQGV